MKELSRKTGMTSDLFRVEDVVTPSCGSLAGAVGEVSAVDRYVTIRFAEPLKKYPDDPARRASREWRYEPSNVRLVAFPKRKLNVKKD